MADTIPLLGPNDTTVNPGARAEPVSEPEPRRTTVLPRIEWRGDGPQIAATGRERFEHLSALGKGGMGEVVLARDHDVERTVAIKRLPRSNDVGLLARFVEEIRTVGALEHPNIVPLHDVGVDEHGQYFFVMKHLRGEGLDTLINRLRAGDPATHARFPFHVRVQVFMSILNAMAYAHQQGFLHRDLKPANLIVGPYGEVTVMDWGLARRITPPSVAPDLAAECGEPAQAAPARGTPSPARRQEPAPIPLTVEAPRRSTRDGTALQTQVGSLMGTPFYMSPEQARGEHDRLDVRSDVYALTVVFHEFLYLTHYLDELTSIPDIIGAVQQRTPQVFDVRQSAHQPAVPAELGWYLLKGFEKDPAKRYQSVPEMIRALQRIVDGRIAVQCQRTFAKRMLQEGIHRVDAHPVAIITGTTLVLCLILAGLVNTFLTFF